MCAERLSNSSMGMFIYYNLISLPEKRKTEQFHTSKHDELTNSMLLASETVKATQTAWPTNVNNKLWVKVINQKIKSKRVRGGVKRTRVVLNSIPKPCAIP